MNYQEMIGHVREIVNDWFVANLIDRIAATDKTEL